MTELGLPLNHCLLCVNSNQTSSAPPSVPALLDSIQDTDASQEPIVASFVRLFRNLCAGLGPVASRTRLRPQFTERLQQLETSLADGRGGSEAMPSLAIIPVYLVGVLASTQVRFISHTHSSFCTDFELFSEIPPPVRKQIKFKVLILSFYSNSSPF